MLTFLTVVLPLIVTVAAAAVFIILMAAAGYDRRQGYGVGPELSPKQLHHEYVGALLVLLSFLPMLVHLDVVGWILAPILRWAGAAIMVDDCWEHAVQLGGKAGYKTALHRFWEATFWKFAWMRWLVTKLDRLLGAKPAGIP